MKHYLGISCEEYQNLDNISFCHSDSIKLLQTLTKYGQYWHRVQEMRLVILM